jgi:hypothetical protein
MILDTAIETGGYGFLWERPLVLPVEYSFFMLSPRASPTRK